MFCLNQNIAVSAHPTQIILYKPYKECHVDHLYCVQDHFLAQLLQVMSLSTVADSLIGQSKNPLLNGSGLQRLLDPMPLVSG